MRSTCRSERVAKRLKLPALVSLVALLVGTGAHARAGQTFVRKQGQPVPLAVAAAPAAASALSAQGAYELGLALRNGDGRPRDSAAALHRLAEAAEGGVPEAMFILSHMLATGEGTAPDAAAARRWLERAAQLDYPEALQELAMMEADPHKADELLREAGHALRHRGERVDRR